MLLNYLKDSLRLIKKHSGFAALNLLGLSIGLASCLLIILYVNFELKFDKFHEKGSDIYRVVMRQPGNQVMGSTSDWWVVSPAILKPTWEAEFPEIDQITRTINQSYIFKLSDQFVEEKVLIVDPEFFDIFSFTLKSGIKTEVLNELYSMVISQKMAEKYFGKEDPIGKIMVKNDGKQFYITGVLEKIPNNSHLQFDFLASYNTLESMSGKSLLNSNWLNNSYTTYLTLQKNTKIEQFDTKLRKYDVKGFNDKEWSFHLQPLYDIHFNRQIRGTGDMGTIYIFISIGVFIMFIACFNYMNLYIAHYRAHTKYISIKKVVGASRMQLVQQFLSESLLMVLFSYVISSFTVWLILPYFNDFLGQELEFSSIWNYQVLLISLGVIMMMAIISGIYPAILLSKIQLAKAIKGGIEKFSKGGLLIKKAVVVIQFSVSILLIVFTFSVFKQLKYTGNKSLGYQKEHIIYMYAGPIRNKINAFKQELLKDANIAKVSASSGIPSQLGWSNIPVWEGQAEGENPFFYRLEVDYDFLELYEIELQDGRNFSKDMLTDNGNAYILNFAAVERVGFKEPLGSKFGFNKKLGIVIGVTKDFHFESLHKPITPLGIGVAENGNFNYLSIKLNNEDFKNTLIHIEKVWKEIAPNNPLKYYFFDERLEQLYAKDQQLSKSLKYFSIMALFISCLGIYGLMSFSLKERTKEIGIRNVLGASFMNQVNLLTRETLIILLFATLVGGSIGWVFSNNWLNNFAYRSEMGFDIIIYSALITLIMTMMPISFKLLKSITANPVQSLRSE